MSTHPHGLPSLSILSAGAAKGLVTGLAPTFGQNNQYEIVGEFGAVGLMREHFLNGKPCDLIILSESLIKGLEADGHLQADSARPLGVVRTGVAYRANDATPKLANAQELANALRSAPEIYFPDPQKATAGIHFARVMAALGVEDDVATRLRPYPNGASAMKALSETDALGAIGCTQVTEILYTPGVKLAAVLPQQFELATVYSAAIPKKSANPEMAQHLIDLLTGHSASEMRQSGGFESA